uniref:Uncharacterized protein n=1 Tax=Lotharella globosa TaxID=91324 RepID=A0A7S3Z0U8_9EUKA
MRKGVAVALAGGLGGSLVFGDDTSINTQINLYVFSRVAKALGHLILERQWIPKWKHWYRIWAGLSWALVMVLFSKKRHTLQKSLTSSMIYLYEDSDIPGSAFVNL